MNKKICMMNWILICLALISMTACTSTRLISSWEPEQFGLSASETLMVAGITKDMRKRVIFENAMVEALQKKGMEAVPSCDMIPKATLLDKATAIAEAKAHAINFVIVSRLVEAGASEISIPAYNPILTGYTADRNIFGEIHKFRKARSVRQYHAKLRLDLYNVTSGEIIWSGVSDTIKPDSKLTAKDVLISLTATISEELLLLSTPSS